MAAPVSSRFPLADADLCVKCGLCLPHCPSYLDTRNEADSPRGRIALMQALAEERIALTPRLEQHLDGCLGCRACDRVCPASVPYGALIDAGRALLAERRPARIRFTALLSGLLSRRFLRRALAVLLWTYPRSGLQFLVRQLSRFDRLDSLLPPIEFPRAPRLPAVAAARGRVEIFGGCVGDIVEPGLVGDLAKLLAACGFEAVLPAAQTCCGAIDQHAGRAAAALHLVQRNLRAFGDERAPILPLATGCAATLLDYPRLAGTPGARFARRLRDPLDFLREHGEALRFESLPVRVAIHEACSQRNVIKHGGAVHALLSRIPGIELVDLDSAAQCCGAAGTYFVSEAASADRLLEAKLVAAKTLAPQIIVSANIGCSLHLAAGLRRAGIRATVLHPLTLLSRQMS